MAYNDRNFQLAMQIVRDEQVKIAPRNYIQIRIYTDCNFCSIKRVKKILMKFFKTDMVEIEQNET